MPGLWPIFSARWTSPTATTHATSPSMARRCERAKTATARLSMCSRRSAAACKQLSDHLISSLTAATSPQALLRINRDHWGIEIMHRNKDMILGEDGYTNRCDNAPRNIFSLTGFVLKILKSVSSSPTRAIERFQDDRN